MLPVFCLFVCVCRYVYVYVYVGMCSGAASVIIIGGGRIFILSCSALLTSFEIDCFYGLWTQIYEYSPPPNYHAGGATGYVYVYVYVGMCMSVYVCVCRYVYVYVYRLI